MATNVVAAATSPTSASMAGRTITRRRLCGGEMICTRHAELYLAAIVITKACASSAAAFCIQSTQRPLPFVRTRCSNSSSNSNSNTDIGLRKLGTAFSSSSSSFSSAHASRIFSFGRPSSSSSSPLFSSLDEAQPSGGKVDESEWQAVVAALQMYKAAYSDLKVPSRFVVPSLPPWPGEYFCSHCDTLIVRIYCIIIVSISMYQSRGILLSLAASTHII